MAPTDGSIFHGDCSSPVIFDTDNMEILQDNDLEFFIPNSTPAPSSALDDMLDTVMDFGDPLQAPAYTPSTTYSSKTISASLLHAGDNGQPTSAPSSSPTSSLQDSSSDSSRNHKRKSSSNSSHSVPAATDTQMTEDPDPFGQLTMGGDGPGFAGYSDLGDISLGRPNELATHTDVEMSNRDMENHFDFDSAASSPSVLGTTGNRQTRVLSSSFSSRKPPQANNRYQLDSQSTMVGVPPRIIDLTTLITPQRRKPSSPRGAFAVHGAREASPLSSAVTVSLETSPSMIFNNHSPSPDLGAGFDGGPMLGESSQNPAWPTTFDPTDPSAPNPSSNTSLPPAIQSSLASPFLPAKSLSRRDVAPKLTLHPTPLKSRVETQIPIKMTLYPMPAGVTKLHLPTHTISKPKLLAKPPPSPSPDTLELHATLVCTSAMQNPERRKRTLARAAGAQIKLERVSRSPSQDGLSDPSDDDETKPLNGGEVKICTNCIIRERKRAARKKVKRVEEEESWIRDEQRRVIVFNTHEIKDWQQPTKESSIEPGTEMTPSSAPIGAMQVEAPMRIACYCRHQSEKLGFQVIFTIKDHNDNLVAQAITASIMITDDHKTHAPPQSATPQSATPQSATPQSVTPQSSANPPDPIPLPPDPGVFSNVQGFGTSSGNSVSMPQFRLSHSTSDLQSLPHGFPQQFPPIPMPYTAPQAYSVSHTPRNLSRPASISGPAGPSTKKRKASSSGRVPTGLAMTRLETQMMPHDFTHTGHPSTTPPSATSPYFPNGYSLPPESPYIQPPLNPQFHTGPPTPNSNDHGFYTPAHRSQSMENLPMHSLFSASNSPHLSRVPSPTTGQRNNTLQLYQQAQAQMAQQVANGLYGLPLALNPHRPPVIHKLIPNEGPKAGGIEVTCLGSGFCQGLEVFFGENLATTTTFWGDTSLVCLLPPALRAGTVAVTFKHDQQQMHSYSSVPIPKQHVLFQYVDDDEHQLLRLALSVLGQKMTGKREDVRDIARRIVGSSSGDPWGAVGGGSSSAGGQQRPASAFDASILGFMDAESALLKCLDLIDLDNSPNQARLNSRRGSGQTMLHLACMLGFYRFVAALLARGANPEPRDRGGYTPMHYAAMHNHAQIVRRLILSGADPNTRSLRGSIPADLTMSEEVLASTRKLKHHSRRRSGGSPRSNVSSSASLRSLWEVTPHSHTAAVTMNAADCDDEHKKGDDGDIDSIGEPELWMRSKRSSRRISMSADVAQMGNDPPRGVPEPERDGPATPFVVAWRQHLTAQFQQLWNRPNFSNFSNLPNLPNLPHIPPMPALPDYQNYLGNPMGRLNSLVPLRSPSRSSTSSSSESEATKEGDYRWWELFSVPSAPPAYEEIYPNRESDIAGKKIAHVAHAAVDAFADQKCAEAFDQQTTSADGRSSPVIELRIDGGGMAKATQEELQAAHARKVKKIRSDRNLFFIWIPLLVVMLVAMLKNLVPQVWDGASRLYFYTKGKSSGRVAEVS